jgi:hypothetical protein
MPKGNQNIRKKNNGKKEGKKEGKRRAKNKKGIRSEKEGHKKIKKTRFAIPATHQADDPDGHP